MKVNFTPSEVCDGITEKIISFILYTAYKDGSFNFAIGMEPHVWEAVPELWIDHWFTIEGDEHVICLSDKRKSKLANKMKEKQAIPYQGIWIPVVFE